MEPRQIEIGGHLTFDEWELILTDYQIGEPEPKLEYIDVPFADGKLDISEAVTGDVKYENRELTFTFDLLRERGLWEPLLRDIRSRLHGRNLIIRVPDDHAYYYKGRVKVEGVEKSGVVQQVEMSVDAEPYKLKNQKTVVRKTIPASGSIQVNLRNDRKQVVPSVTTTGDMTFMKDDAVASVSAGTWQMRHLLLTMGDNILTVDGGPGDTVTFEYQEGAL